MDESILTSVKKLIGMTEEYDVFDNDIITHINSVFMILRQMGVGPANGFYIEDDSSVWSDFIPMDDPNFHGVQTYMYLKTQMVFDPPSSSILKESKQKMIDELEWRLHVEADY